MAVTRCDQIWQISPLWAKFKVFGNSFVNLYSTWKNFNLLFYKFAIFIFVNGQLKPDLVTLYGCGRVVVASNIRDPRLKFQSL